MKGHLDAVKQLYQPSVGAMTSNLPALGESLQTAALELARDPTLERVDAMVCRLKGAEAGMMHLRKALAREADV